MNSESLLIISSKKLKIEKQEEKQLSCQYSNNLLKSPHHPKLKMIRISNFNRHKNTNEKIKSVINKILTLSLPLSISWSIKYLGNVKKQAFLNSRHFTYLFLWSSCVFYYINVTIAINPRYDFIALNSYWTITIGN